MSFGILNAVLVLLYWAITKNFFPELSGANYYFGLALCVIAAKVFASRKDNPAVDSIVFRALLPLTGTAVILPWSVNRFPTRCLRLRGLLPAA